MALFISPRLVDTQEFHQGAGRQSECHRKNPLTSPIVRMCQQTNQEKQTKHNLRAPKIFS